MLSKVRKFAASSIAMLLLGTMCACGQVERPNTVSGPPPEAPKAYCAAFETIGFAEMDPDLPPDADDVGNQADTKVTVAQILAHNAVWFALCTNPLTPPG